MTRIFDGEATPAPLSKMDKASAIVTASSPDDRVLAPSEFLQLERAVAALSFDPEAANQSVNAFASEVDQGRVQFAHDVDGEFHQLISSQLAYQPHHTYAEFVAALSTTA